MFGSHYKNVPHNFSKGGERKKKNHCIKVLVSFSLSVKISSTLKRPHSDKIVTKTNFHVTIHNQRLSENRRLIYGESLLVTNVSY